MPDMLFDRAKATEQGPFPLGTKPFDLLESWNSPSAESLRRRVEAMFDAYPEEGRETLWGRCRSKSISQANDAFFELFIGHLFVSSGYKLLAVENPLPGSTYAIDFTFGAPDGKEFLVEVVSYNKPKQLTGPTKLLEDVLNAVDAIESPHYEVIVSKSWGAMTQAVGKKFVVQMVGRWLASLPHPSHPDAQARLLAKDFELSEGCGVTLSPRLRRPNSKSKGLIAAIPVRSSDSTVIDGIRRKLHQKAFKYGRLHLPLILALNVAPDIAASDKLFKKAVFGPPKFDAEPKLFTGHPNEYVPTCGALIEPGGPLSAIPAVLGFVGVNPLQFGAAQGRVYHSKFAKHFDLSGLGMQSVYWPSELPALESSSSERRRRYPRAREESVARIEGY